MHQPRHGISSRPSPAVKPKFVPPWATYRLTEAGMASKAFRPPASSAALVLAMASCQWVIHPVLCNTLPLRPQCSECPDSEQRLAAWAACCHVVHLWQLLLSPKPLLCTCQGRMPCARQMGALELCADGWAAAWQVQATLHIERLTCIVGRPKVHSPAAGTSACCSIACTASAAGCNAWPS